MEAGPRLRPRGLTPRLLVKPPLGSDSEAGSPHHQNNYRKCWLQQEQTSSCSATPAKACVLTRAPARSLLPPLPSVTFGDRLSQRPSPVFTTWGPLIPGKSRPGEEGCVLFFAFCWQQFFFFPPAIKMSHMLIRGSMDDKSKAKKITLRATALTPTMWVFGAATCRHFCLLARGWVFDTNRSHTGPIHLGITAFSYLSCPPGFRIGPVTE